jgi:hypothetical protein
LGIHSVLIFDYKYLFNKEIEGIRGFYSYITKIFVYSHDNDINIPERLNDQTWVRFENMNWFSIKVLFELMNSGGSKSRRHFGSSAEFNLSLFLYIFNYSNKELYRSILINKYFQYLYWPTLIPGLIPN